MKPCCIQLQTTQDVSYLLLQLLYTEEKGPPAPFLSVSDKKLSCLSDTLPRYHSALGQGTLILLNTGPKAQG